MKFLQFLPMMADTRVCQNFCRTPARCIFPADMRTKVRSCETNKFSANVFDTKLKRNTHMFGVTKCWGHHKFRKEPSWDHHLKKRLLCGLINGIYHEPTGRPVPWKPLFQPIFVVLLFISSTQLLQHPFPIVQ